MHSIGFVTTCKGRLHHLKKTLPALVAENPSEIIVVDYGCPQHTGDWVETHFPQVRVIRVDDDPGFCLSRARNLGAVQITSHWICFIDADIQIRSGFLDWLRDHINSLHYYVSAQINGVRDRQLCGTVVCTKEAFDRIDGYDDVINGHGGEDNDLYYRLRVSGLSEDNYPIDFVDPIFHDESERVTFYEVKDLAIQHAINLSYHKAKKQLMRRHYNNIQPPLSVRQMLMTHVRQTVLRWPITTREPKVKFRVEVKSRGNGLFGSIYRKLMRVDQLIFHEESLQKGVRVCISPRIKTRIRYLLGK
ncbi:MAG: glycosyltransferase [Gammaproteobacteria bacterium]|nr:glycosyltransferase [Gammaproteobacteria bacterium]